MGKYLDLEAVSVMNAEGLIGKAVQDRKKAGSTRLSEAAPDKEADAGCVGAMKSEE